MLHTEGEKTEEMQEEQLKLKGRAGRRPGSGRKPNYLKRLGMEPITAAKILANFDELDLWRGPLEDKQPSIRLQTLQYLTDRRDGKASGLQRLRGLVHAHTAYRDPKLALLSAEELDQLDVLTKKLALPSPDGPQNQIESNTATEEAEVLSEGGNYSKSHEMANGQ